VNESSWVERILSSGARRSQLAERRALDDHVRDDDARLCSPVTPISSRYLVASS